MRKSIKKKARATPVTSVGVLKALKLFLDKVSPDFTKRLQLAEASASKKSQELRFIENKLEGLLTEEQIEAAKLCNMTPAIYALNWIELMQEGKMFERLSAPTLKFPAYVRNFPELKNGEI
jgi:hypothetical protein